MRNTERAIAYLKGSQPEDEQPVIRLSSKEAPVIRPYFGQLHICYLVDDGQSYKYVQNCHIEEDKISADELHQIGLRNLKSLTTQRNAQVRPYGNVFSFTMGGDFEASVVLLDEFWAGEFRKFVKENYAIAVPARDVLAFCSAESRQGIMELQQVIDRVWPTGDHLVSNKIHIGNKDNWQVHQLSI